MNAPGDERFHAAMASPTRRAVLAAVASAETDEPVDAQRIAGRLDLHVTTVRFHLDQLEAVRLVRRVAAAEKRRGRPRVRYMATSGGASGANAHEPGAAQASATQPGTPQPEVSRTGTGTGTGTGTERAQAQLIAVLAAALVDQAGADGDAGRAMAIAAGHAWGQSVRTAVIPEGERPAALVRTLEELGFGPEPRGSEVLLHGCPFRDAAREHPQIVCAAHLGMIRELMHDTTNAIELLPMVQPELCTVVMPERSALRTLRTLRDTANGHA